VPVLVRQGSVLACSFHPELTADRRIHAMFAELCESYAVETQSVGPGRPSGARWLISG